MIVIYDESKEIRLTIRELEKFNYLLDKIFTRYKIVPAEPNTESTTEHSYYKWVKCK